jgi:hypothetical protein
LDERSKDVEEPRMRSVRLPADFWGWIEERAARERRSVNRQVEVLVAEAMQREREAVAA